MSEWGYLPVDHRAHDIQRDARLSFVRTACGHVAPSSSVVPREVGDIGRGGSTCSACIEVIRRELEYVHGNVRFFATDEVLMRAITKPAKGKKRGKPKGKSRRARGR